LRSFHIATASVQCSRPPPQVINRSSTGCDKAVGAVTTNSATAMTAIHEIRLIEKSRSFRANIAVKWVETQMTPAGLREIEAGRLSPILKALSIIIGRFLYARNET